MYVVVAFIYLFLGSAHAFTPDDVPVSTSEIVDPEFDDRSNVMVWQDLKGNMWGADIDPVTGEVAPTDGKGYLIDTGLASILTIGNGPEFGYQGDDLFAVYTKVLSNGVRVLSVAKEMAAGSWTTNLLGESTNNFRPFASTDDRETMRIVYPDTSNEQNGVSWREWNSAATERTFFNAGTSGGRWIPNQNKFVAPVKDEQGITQIAIVDTDNESVTQISFDSRNKFAFIAWHAPEFDGIAISALIDGQSVGVWTQVEDTWQQVLELSAPSVFDFASSPEPFVYNGRSYIAMIAAEGIGYPGFPYVPNSQSEVWVLGLEGGFARRVDDGTSNVRRVEPEPFITDNGPIIYFNAVPVDASAPQLLHRAFVGLSGEGADTDNDGVADNIDNCTEISNTDQIDSDGDGFGNLCDEDINNDCMIDWTDVVIINNNVGSTIMRLDLNLDGTVDTLDVARAYRRLNNTPGPAASNSCSLTE